MISNLRFRLRNKVQADKGNVISIGGKTRIKKSRISIKGRNNRLIIGSGVRINSSHIEINGENCLIEIGDNTLIGRNSYLSAREKGITLIIGKNCALSRNVKVMTSDGHSILAQGRRVNRAASIHIMDHAWIADGAVILKGVTVGRESIVGINSVLTKTIKDNTAAAGNPAEVIREGIVHRNELIY